MTGASRGIGKAIAKKLALQGAKVIINYNGSEEKALAVKAEIEEAGGQAVVYQCNVADYAACETFIQTVIKEQGSLDILVNNAGDHPDGLLMKMSEEDFDQVVNTNLKGAFHTMRFAARQMLKQRSGRIINMSSVVGVSGNAGQVNYAASKAGVIGMTKSAARELASRGVTVNAVAPGFISTDMTDVLSDKVKEARKDRFRLADSGSRKTWPRRGISGVRRSRIHHRPGAARRRRDVHVMRPASAEETAFADLSADMQFSMSILGECPQRDEAIAESSWAGRMIAGQGRANAHSEIYIYERTGSMKRRVVVTGLGAVTPIGNTVEEFWNNIKKGTVGIGEITKFDTTDYKVKLPQKSKILWLRREWISNQPSGWSHFPVCGSGGKRSV